MIKSQVFLLLVLFSFSQPVYSNTKPFPGYYIDSKGDTVRCDIEYNDRNQNPKTIQVLVNGSIKEFGPEDIRGFGVDGYVDYLSAKVSYHEGPDSGPDLLYKFSDNVITKTCFLQVVESGFYSLYTMIRPERVYLFYSTQQKPVTELLYRVKMDNDSVKEDNSYRQELVNLFMNEGLTEKYFERINQVAYNASQIGSLFIILNETRTGVKSKKKSRGDFQIELFVGAIRNSFPTTFDGVYVKSNQFDPSYSGSGGVNFLYSFPGHFKAFKVGLSLGYNGFNRTISDSGSNYHAESAAFYYTTTYDETITVKRSMLLSNFYVMYLFNPLSKVKVFAKAGLNYNFSIGNNSGVVSTFTSGTRGIMNGNVPFKDSANSSLTIYSLKSGYLAPVFSTGVISGRSKFEFTYWPPVSISDPLDIYGFNISGNTFFKLGSMGIFYYFSLFSSK